MLIAWVSLCIAAAWTLRNRVDVAATLILGLWVAIPSVAGDVLTGIPFYSGSLANMHPAAWFTWVYAVVLLAAGRPGWWRALAAAPGELMLLGWVSLQLAALTLINPAGASPRGLIGNFGAGVIWLVFAATASWSHAHWPALLRNSILVAAAINALLSMLQVLLDRVWPFDPYRRAYQPDFKEGADRTSGSLDHPLVLSLLLVIALPIAVTLTRRVHAYALTTLLFVGLLQSGSRAGLVVGCAAVVAVLLLQRGRRGDSMVILAGVGILFAALLFSGLGSNVLRRFGQEAESTALRTEAYSFFADNWSSFLVAGGGYASSFDLKDSGALQSSLENAYVMLAVDAGIVAAAAFAVTMLVIVARSIVSHGFSARVGATLAGLTCAATFSSFMVQSAALILVLSPLALCLADGAVRERKGGDPHVDPEDVPPRGAGLQSIRRPPARRSSSEGAPPARRIEDRGVYTRKIGGEA